MYTLPSEPGSIGHTLDAGFKLYAIAFKKILVLSVLAAITISLPTTALLLAMPMFIGDAEPSMGFFGALGIGFIVCILVYMWLYLAAMCKVGGLAYGQDLTNGACMGTGLRCLFPVLLAGILYSLAMMGGFILLIIPGFILMVSLIFYALCIVLDQDGIIESLRHSHRLVWGNWWRTFIIGSVMMIIYYVIFIAIQLPFGIVDAMMFDPELAGLPTFGQAMLSMAADTIATVITFPMMISVFVLVYHDLKLRKEGHDLDARVEALTVGA